MADLDEFGDDEDENFDKPNPKSQLKRGREKESDEFGEDKDEDDLEDLEVEIAEDDEPKGDKKLNSRNRDRLRDEPEEERLGRRRQKSKPRESRVVRELETQLNNERLRGDNMQEELNTVKSTINQISTSNIDSQISEATTYLNQAKKAHAAAVKDGDGDAAAEALEVMMEAKETLTLLNQAKKAPSNGRREVEIDDKVTNANNRRDLPKPDPKVLRMFDRWHENNDWYDPALRDKNSRIAFHIDNAMNAEGYDPRTPEYWEEFTKRCQENPTLSKVMSDDDYEEDEPMPKREKRESAPAKRSAPLNERSNSTQSSKKIVVSRQRADAMREMGLQPGTSEWKRMAKKYEAYDKQRSA